MTICDESSRERSVIFIVASEKENAYRENWEFQGETNYPENASNPKDPDAKTF